MSSSVAGVAPRRSPSTQTSAFAGVLATSISPYCGVRSICNRRPLSAATESSRVAVSYPGLVSVTRCARPGDEPQRQRRAAAELAVDADAGFARVARELEPAVGQRQLDVRQLLRLIGRDEEPCSTTRCSRPSRTSSSCSPRGDLERPPASRPRQRRRRARWRRADRCAARRRPNRASASRPGSGARRRRATSSSRTSARCRSALNSSRCTPGVSSVSTSGVVPSGVPSSSTCAPTSGSVVIVTMPGQLRQRQRDRLIGERPDLDLRIERVVARQLGRDAMRARAQQEPVAELQLEQRARQADGGRRRLDVERDGFRREREPGHGRQAPRTPSRRRSSPLLTPRRAARAFVAAPGLNAIGVIASSAVRPTARELVEVRRRRIAGRDDPLDANRERVAPPMRHSSRARSNAMTSPSRSCASARQRLAADAQVARAATGLHEEHVVEAADLDAAVHAVEHDVGVGTGAERDRQLGRAELAPPAAVLDRHDRAASAALPLSAVTVSFLALDGFDADYADRR